MPVVRGELRAPACPRHTLETFYARSPQFESSWIFEWRRGTHISGFIELVFDVMVVFGISHEGALGGRQDHLKSE